MQPDGMNIPFSFNGRSQVDMVRRYHDPLGTLGEKYSYIRSPLEGQIIESLEVSGLTISNQAFRTMEIDYIESSYGNFGIQFGKQLSRMINNPEVVASIFEQGSTSYALLSALDTGTDSPALNSLFGVLRQIGRRGKRTVDLVSDLPESSEHLGVGWGSCKYAESKYLESAREDTLNLVYIKHKPFWSKTAGDASYINLTPLLYKGIEIPPGWIFAHNFSKADSDFMIPVRPSCFPYQLEEATKLFPDAMELMDPTEFVFLQQEFASMANRHEL